MSDSDVPNSQPVSPRKKPLVVYLWYLERGYIRYLQIEVNPLFHPDFTAFLSHVCGVLGLKRTLSVQFFDGEGYTQINDLSQLVRNEHYLLVLQGCLPDSVTPKWMRADDTYVSAIMNWFKSYSKLQALIKSEINAAYEPNKLFTNDGDLSPEFMQLYEKIKTRRSR